MGGIEPGDDGSELRLKSPRTEQGSLGRGRSLRPLAKGHPFERSGIAALTDLGTTQWREIFDKLEQQQVQFLEHAAAIFSAEYSWPRDPLHWWSRIWEYPYVYHQAARAIESAVGGRRRLVDVGSGVTFLPFALARLGYDVTCTDIDPVCAVDIDRAAQLIDHSPGSVDFRLISDGGLPFKDLEADIVISVSVLEHIADFHTTVREMARILKPSGLLVLTIDLDLRGNSEIGVERHAELMRLLEHEFVWELPEATVHPANQLTNSSGPVRFGEIGRSSHARHLLRQELRRAIGKRPETLEPVSLAVQGLVLRKRDQPASMSGRK